MSVYDEWMSVYDEWISVYDEWMSVYDEWISIYDEWMSYIVVETWYEVILHKIKKVGFSTVITKVCDVISLPSHSNMKNDYFLQIQTTQIHAVRTYILKRQLEGSSYI